MKNTTQKFNNKDIVSRIWNYKLCQYDSNSCFYKIISNIKIFNDTYFKYEYMYEILNLETGEKIYCIEQNLELAPQYNESLKYNL